MKIIVFLVLAGLSLAAPGITDTNPDTRLKDVSNELKKSPDLMRKLRIITCNYKSEFDDNAANFENVVNALRSTSNGRGFSYTLGKLLCELGYKRRTLTGAIHALSSTICRMKIIVFLVLAGLSLAAPGITDTNPDTRLKYMSNELKKSPDFMRKLGIITCNYESEFDDNAANFENGVNVLRSTSDRLGLSSTVAKLLCEVLGQQPRSQ
ncbi:uncharacterized protein ACNLHF_028246 isoform 1-T1 [Anomaloglossus baeobatrachus]|uniref:uncharacterized protein LOC142249405 isoform X1 n=1 Tax=Anomaloglossus baeobatrachus TaxID=238106 RepID=UPI003F4F6D21